MSNNQSQPQTPLQVAIINVPLNEWNELNSKVTTIYDKLETLDVLENNEKKEWLNSKEAREYLGGISKSTIDRYIRIGKLNPTSVIGESWGKRLFLRSELDQLLREGMNR